MASDSFTVLQFNILGRTLAGSCWFFYAKAFLPGVAKNALWVDGAGYPPLLAWDSPLGRLAVLLRQIRAANADVMCLQEVDCFDELRQALPEWDGVWQQRPNGRLDGCAVFYRRTLFQAVHSHPVAFSDPTGRLALLVLLRHGPSGQPLTVVTSHLHWDALAGYHNVQLQEIYNAMQQPPFHGTPTIFAADFNAPLSDALQQFLPQSGLKSAHVTLGVTLTQTSYGAPTFYFSNSRWRYNAGSPPEVIDHILYSSTLVPLAALDCHCVPSLECGDDALADPANVPPPVGATATWQPSRTATPQLGLPNAHCGSDHVPLGARFRLSATP